MRTCFLDDIEPFEQPLSSEALALAMGGVADHSATLLPPERHAVAAMNDQRVAEYSSGRRVAREALRQLGLVDIAIPRQGRAPLWPDGVVGSIAHSRHFALAIVGFSRRYRGIGVDLVPERRVGADVAARVLSRRERSMVSDEIGYTRLFSAKEAIYKATNPATCEYLGFRDVELSMSASDQFEARATKPCNSAQLVAVGQGFVGRAHGHWLTFFVIRNQPRLEDDRGAPSSVAYSIRNYRLIRDVGLALLTISH